MLTTRPSTRRTARFAAVALAAAVSAALLGCAPAADAPVEMPTEEAPAQSELTGEVTVFAAKSLQAAFDELIAEFTEENPGVTFAPPVYDGSSTLVTQLEGGAQADVFASADEPNMEKAEAAGLLDGAAENFATNELVIAVAPGNPLGIASLADLVKPTDGGEPPITVICAAEVPCGNAARTLLDLNGVSLTPASEEQNVGAVLAKVPGEADAGLVYRTDVKGDDGRVDSVDIEGSAEHLNVYPIALLKESQSPEAAQAFIDFVLSDRGQAVLAGYGFGAP